MKPIIIENSVIPSYLSLFINIRQITLFPFIISENRMDSITLRHEMIHIEQQKELLVVFFLILYVLYWLNHKIQGMTNYEAYMLIPFEREAYFKQYSPEYILKRKPCAWRYYKKSTL